jgi:glycine oxidase
MKSVVVVGAGIVGLHCAVRLAKAGARVTLVEAESEDVSVFGPGASAAAAGMLAPIEAAASPHEGLALASFDLWRNWREGAQWADGVRFDGGVIATRDRDETVGFAGNAARLRRPAVSLSPGQFCKRTGLRAKVEHALFVEDEGVADPLRVLSGLLMQARAHGVLVAYNRDAARVSANLVATHEGDTYEADAVVLAPGVWASEALMAAAPALKLVRPAKGHMAAAALERPLRPNLRTPAFYLAQRNEDVVLGSTLEPDRYDRRVDPARVAAMFAAAEALLPGELRNAGCAWAGVRPMSPDGWPLIGPTGDGIFVAAGHSRNGWLLAPITAEIITAYVFGAEISPDWAALSPQRFDNEI